ncbi:MauE/DoxX family redox-associated membrane protein [Streptomyces himalayensis]|uniref:MauE/DoxX family redox-associated membrane protein n=1 Tax=Streptomyces himalayensis TaxID=2820085 RepID=UPI001FE8514F|nr:MauE/DoxX family redox-associated membrane protein [Streptomyces himalayensis]
MESLTSGLASGLTSGLTSSLTSGLVPALVPLVLAGLLGWTGAVKLFGRGTVRQAPKTALARMLRSSERTVLVLRTVGAAELVAAVGLLALPASEGSTAAAAPGVAAAALGAGFLGYLARARATAPESSCGCSAGDDAPITWRTFARAAAVLAGGTVSAACALGAAGMPGGSTGTDGAAQPWWTVIQEQPFVSLGFLLLSSAVLVGLSADLDRWWRLPLRRFRLRLFGHPFNSAAARGSAVPVAATVELLERSLAWQAASPVVRSGLVDHWDEDGWRILQFTGVYEEGGAARPVAVLFALDATVSTDTTAEPAVRIAIVDADTGETVAAELLSPAVRPALPLAG